MDARERYIKFKSTVCLGTVISQEFESDARRVVATSNEDTIVISPIPGISYLNLERRRSSNDLVIKHTNNR